MAVTSALVPLGTPAPDFALPDLDGTAVSLGDLAGDVLVVVFACNHCPYVQHIENELGRAAADLGGPRVSFVAICTNDAAAYPEDDVPHLKAQASRAGWRFPYLVDEEQRVGQAFEAVCTPDFFVYGPDRRLAYRGAFDASTPKNGEPVDGHLLRDAVNRLLAGESVPEPHRPSMGCSIKWLPGKKPATGPS